MLSTDHCPGPTTPKQRHVQVVANAELVSPLNTASFSSDAVYAPQLDYRKRRKLSTSQISAHAESITNSMLLSHTKIGQRPSSIQAMTWTDRILGLMLLAGILLPLGMYALYGFICMLGIGTSLCLVFAATLSVSLVAGLIPLLPFLTTSVCLMAIILVISRIASLVGWFVRELYQAGISVLGHIAHV